MNLLSISIQRKRNDYFQLPLEHFVSGLRKIKYVLLELHPNTAFIIERTFTTFLVGIRILLKKNHTFTLGSLQKNKWMILNDKQIFSNPNSLIISWLQTLRLALIGKGKVLKPFWNKQCLEMSLKLWLPTKIDYVGSHSISSKLSLNSQIPNSSFLMKTKINPQNKNSLKTSYPLSTFIPVGTWENGGIRTIKLRIYPSPTQRIQLRQWMGTTRYVYNKVLSSLKTDPTQKYNFQRLRNQFVTRKRKNGEINEQVNEWECETPKYIRAGCVDDLVNAFKVAMINLKHGNINRFNLRFRSRKKSTSIIIPPSALTLDKDTKQLHVYPRYMKEPIRISKDKTLPQVEITKECRIQCLYGDWYLCIPMDANVVEQKDNKKICAQDPGVSTFMTSFSEDEIVQFQQRTETIDALRKKLDLFQSLRAKKDISKRRYTRRQNKIYKKLNGIIDDLHFKTISYLTTHYNLILLPIFESQEMSMKGYNRKMKRNMMGLKHYKFQTRLKDACVLNRNVQCSIVTEEYTSKTCTRCGERNLNMNSKTRILSCPDCNLEIDRDVNGARNILIKTLVGY